MRRLITFFVKAGISALLLYLSLHNINLSGIGQRLRELDFRWMIFVVFILCAQMALVALRWREIVVTCGAKLQPVTALVYTFIGQFFSQVLPSTVGGDAARIWLLARGEAGWSTAAYSVLIDRLVGVSILALVVVGCLPWTVNIIADPTACAVLALIGFGALAGTLIFLGLGTGRLQILERWWLTGHLAAASRAARQLCRSVTGARVAASSFAIHLMTVMAAWGTAMAAHVTIDFVYVLFLVLPVMLIATVPVSLAGWGVRESAMILAFSYAGLAESDGLMVSILFGLATLVIGAVGGIIWLARDYRLHLAKRAHTEPIAYSTSP